MTILALLVVAALAAAILALALGGSSGSPPASSSASTGTGFDGAALPAGQPVHDFALADQHGRRVSLASLRGRVVVLTFLYSRCGAACVVIAQQIRGALDDLARAVPVLIVSADPAGDTPARIARFLREVSLSGRVSYLGGPLRRLRALWSAYRVTPASAGRASFDLHAAVMLLDRRGGVRVLFEQEQLTPENLAHDIGKLEAG
jgi:protein SCO1/2